MLREALFRKEVIFLCKSADIYDIISAKENQATPKAAFGFPARLTSKRSAEQTKEHRRCEFASSGNPKEIKRKPSDAEGGIWFSCTINEQTVCGADKGASKMRVCE